MADTDRELLRLAATATGHKWKWVRCPAYDHEVPGLLLIDSYNDVEYYPGWNPLEDDGDALRLAVKLGLTVEVLGSRMEPHTRVLGKEEEHRADPCRATRRAIVRAAAEIGRAM